MSVRPHARLAAAALATVLGLTLAGCSSSDNAAARDGKFADAPDMEGRDTLLKERLQKDTEITDDEGGTTR